MALVASLRGCYARANSSGPTRGDGVAGSSGGGTTEWAFNERAVAGWRRPCSSSSRLRLPRAGVRPQPRLRPRHRVPPRAPLRPRPRAQLRPRHRAPPRPRLRPRPVRGTECRPERGSDRRPERGRRRRRTATIAFVGPCCNGVDWLTPVGRRRRRGLDRQDLRPPDDLHRQGSGVRPAGRRPRRVLGDLRRQADLDLQPAQGRDLARRRRRSRRDDVKFSFETVPQPQELDGAGVLLRAAEHRRRRRGNPRRDGDRASPASRSIDATTLALTFTAPNALFPTTISELFILPKHALKDIPLDQIKTSDCWTTKQIGTGPVQVGQVHPGQSIELVPFADYWRGAPKLDRAHPARVPGHRRRPARLRQRRDRLHLPHRRRGRAREDEPERRRPAGRLGRQQRDLPATRQHPEFANPLFRQALLTAIDRQAIVDNIYGGGAELVPCLYGRPNLTAGVEPHALRSGEGQGLWPKSGVDVATLGEIT